MYKRGYSFESIVVVKKRFRGSLEDIIFLNIGGGIIVGG